MSGIEYSRPPLLGRMRDIDESSKGVGKVLVVADDGDTYTYLDTETLRGPKGDQGDPGPQGPTGDAGPKGDTGDQGPEGPQGEQGEPGTNGTDGASAYDIAVADGFIGTESEWLASLVGPQGEQGVQGPKGDTGDTGPKGDTGETGPKGDQGDPGPNEVSTSTATNITGILKGDGSAVGAATAGTDYVAVDDSRLSDAREPTAHAASHAAAGSDPLTLSKSQVGLDQVDNTSDANKPVSTATQTALDGKAASSHTHTVSDITDLPVIAKSSTGNALVQANATGTINDSFLPTYLAKTNSANTFTANQTISTSGSSSANPRSLLFGINIGEYSRFGFAGANNGVQSGSGQRTQIYSWLVIDLLGDRQAAAPSFVTGTGTENVSVRIASTRTASRPLVVQGAASQSGNLTEWWDSSGSLGAYISPGFNQSINGWFRPGSYTVATVPTVGVPTGAYIDVVDGNNADASAGVLCRFDGTNWRTVFNNTVVTT